MPTIKISGLDAILADSAIDSAMGFQSAGRSMFFSLYKGPVVTRAEIATAVNLLSFRSADLLYFAQLPNQSKPAQGIAGGGNYVAASNTGDATWFMLCGVNTSKTIYGAVAGDVSLASGNGQLILTTTNITKGYLYRVPRFLSALFPYSFTY